MSAAITPRSRPYATRNEDNTLYLSCHATKKPFENISPQMVAKYADHVTAIGPNACAACHGSKIDRWGFGMEAKPVIWNEPTT